MASQALVAAGEQEGEVPLFRPEALAERQSQWLGTVLLAPRVSHRLFAAFAVLISAAVLGLLFFADYTRSARISGWLVPQQGLARIFAPQPGVIAEIHVREGMEVRKGAPLLVLSTELRSEAFGATQEEVVRRLVSRRESLLAERVLLHQLHRQDVAGRSKRLDALRLEQQALERERDLQRARLELAEAALERLRPLHARGLIPQPRWQEADDGRLEHHLRLRGLERDHAALRRERLALEDELRAAPLRHRTQVALIDRSIAALEQELAQAEPQRQIVIPAPQDGLVTAIQAELGGRADPTKPLLSIVPAGSILEARLFVPGSAIGFVRPGQRVRLRYQAFPYQKFGHYEGSIATVSRSTVASGDLPQQLHDPAAPNGRAGGEPVYPVTVTLASQSATAYGEPVPLQPGMQLEADVLIENRRLIEWVLDPLFTLTGGWHG